MSKTYQERAVELVAQYTPTARSRASFAYYGDLDLGVTWASTMSQHRDSDALERSNYHVIVADMRARFPDDISEERASHWAVGHCDTLYVRMLGEEGIVTPAGEAILEWMDKLEDYPVADEEDYSELGIELEDECWKSYGRSEFMQAIRNRFQCDYLNIPNETLDKWRSILECETDCDGSYWSVESCAKSMEYSDVLPFDTDGELAEVWRAEDDNLPPYLRSTLPPWIEPIGISMPPEGSMT